MLMDVSLGNAIYHLLLVFDHRM